MSDLKCDVCGASPAYVCCSSLGAMSLAYCRECLHYGCEPYGISVGFFAIMGGSMEAFTDEFRWTLWATVLRAGKTAAEFWSDVESEREAFARKR